jgi:hypothetical protein
MDMTRFAVLVVLATMLGACSPAAAPSDRVATSPSVAETIESSVASIPRLTIADAATCARTAPVTAPKEFRDRLFGSSAAYGNESLWVAGLGEGGVIRADQRFVEPDGSIGWKLGWWRIDAGRLSISGHRLDAAAPPLRAEVSDDYGDQGFVPSGVHFPTEGCWEVTGTVRDASLTFVTFVLLT